MIRKYEVMYIIDQDTTDVKVVQTKLHDVLTANGGKILESEDWGLRDFAYIIKKKKKGYYTVVIVETDSANINEFERVSRIDKNVVRYQVLNTENEKKYIQSTKLSKTDMSKFKEEKKPSRGFDRRMPRRDENPRVEESNEVKSVKEEKEVTVVKEVKEKNAATKEAKPAAKKTTKKVEEKEA
ncbi:30S ribosomal protein S6 [Spiroplasma monobiae]|uniref:Small ribosomal subunit protein bS6 n=1 Tax=Spiroplasma monobiae MQ-1 TaxID=1336748 RepID=A0A2K9LX32_SPISQ|nr:30S ribosomal protein S6 [Spiroplasma monobiae]AUM62274.1 30S ribosomal protein S6 [Spiroplasma monobiae MQ-1]